MRRRVVLIAVVAFLVCVPGSARAALALRDRGPIADGVESAIVRTDGVRTIASTTADEAVAILDVPTGARRTVPRLGSCTWRDIHGHELLWACPAPWPMQYGAVQDIDSGRLENLAPLASIPQSASDVDWSYGRLGDRFAAIGGGGYHFEFNVFVDRATGSQRRVLDSRRDTVVDLDDPQLTRKPCHGQRRGLEYSDASKLVPGPLAIAGPWAATLSGAGGARVRLELQRCGAPIRTIRVPETVTPSQPVINDRFMAWTESRYRQGTLRMRVAVRFHRSGRIRRSTLTSPDTGLSLLLVGHRLFVVEQRRQPVLERRLLRTALYSSSS